MEIRELGEGKHRVTMAQGEKSKKEREKHNSLKC